MAQGHIKINDITPRIQYVADGTLTSFTYPFPIFEDADLEVFLGEVLQVAGYTVQGAGISSGGAVVFDAAPGAGVLITLRRNVAIKRSTDFQEGGDFRARTINDELDRIVAGVQQVKDDSGRAVRLDPTDPTGALTLPDATMRANQYLAFDAQGAMVAAAAPQGGNVVSTFMVTVLDDADAPTARGTLGLVIGTDVLAPGGVGTGLTGVLTTGKHTIGVPAGAMRPATTQGCAALVQSETATNKVNFEHLDFDWAAQEYAYIKFPAPRSSDETAGFTIRNLKWSHSGGTAFGVVWQFDMLALGNGDALDTAWGTAVTVTDTGGVTDTLYSAPESTAITPGGIWAQGDTIWLRVGRKAADVGDTLDVDARFHELEIIITYNAGSDA